MKWFKPKKIFLIEWSYENYSSPYTEFVRARDWYEAWQKVREQHALPIYARTIKEVSSYHGLEDF